MTYSVVRLSRSAAVLDTALAATRFRPQQRYSLALAASGLADAISHNASPPWLNAWLSPVSNPRSFCLSRVCPGSSSNRFRRGNRALDAGG
jgi:hypothetical protein